MSDTFPTIEPSDRRSTAYVLWRFAEKVWPSFGRHITILEEVPEEARDLSWLKAYLLLCGKHRRNWKQTHRYLGELKIRFEQRGEPAKFDSFFAKLCEVTHPYVITAHGFVIPFANRDTAQVLSELCEVMRRIETLGYPSFINSGTLLGAQRNGGFIPHDDDIDLGVILPSATMEEAAEDWQDFAKKLLEAGLLDRRHYRDSTSPIAKIRTPLDVTIDLFPAWFDKAGNCFVWPHTCGEIRKDDILPLTNVTLCGVNVPAPRESDGLLALNYGPNWRMPDPSFVFPWDLARKRFRPLIRRHMNKKGWIKKAMGS